MAYMEALEMTEPGRETASGLFPVPKKILVVDDTDFIRRLVSLILSLEGYDVVESVNGKDALKKLGDESIDMVVTDLHMPEMDGIELVREMRSENSLRHIPALMLTSEFLDSSRQRAFEAGINEWIPKPYIVRKLRELISKHLN